MYIIYWSGLVLLFFLMISDTSIFEKEENLDKKKWG